MANRAAVNRGTSTRETILGSAASIFARLGYEKASLAVVADGLGVTRQAFYYHFRSKSDILAALFDRAMTLVENEAARHGADPTGDRYLRMLDGHLHVVMANIDLIKITTHDSQSIDELPVAGAAARRTAYANRFVNAYAEGAVAGRWRKGNATLTVQANLGALNAVCSWWDPSRGPSALTVRRHVMRTVEFGLAGRA